MRTLSLVALLCAATAPRLARAQFPPQPYPAADPTPSVSSTGRGETRVTPDRATVLLTVETRAPTAAAAAAENARRQQATLDALARLGIPRNLLGTAGYNVFPEQRYVENAPPQIIGYVARSTVRAEVRRIDQVGRVIDTALGAGSNAVGGVRFFASNIEAVRRAALDSAVANACESATVVARASGKQIGGLLQASVGSGFEPAMEMMEMAADAGAMRQAAAPTPINPGEFAVPVTVSTRWLLLPAGAEGAHRCR
jgi:uncharacterized protein YggE